MKTRTLFSMVNTVCVLLLAAEGGSTAAVAAKHGTKLHAHSSKKVIVDLSTSANVSQTDDDYMRLDSIARVSGGTEALRNKIAGVLVGRSPFAGSSRTINVDDISLKLRQFGIDPDTQADFSGSDSTIVSLVASQSTTAPAAASGTITGSATTASTAASVISVKYGQLVTIIISDGDLTITSHGTARDNGAVGDTVRVQREGHYDYISTIVTGDHTVTLEN